MFTHPSHGYFQFVHCKIGNAEQFLDLVVGRGEVDDTLTLRAHGVVVWHLLVLILSFVST